MLDVRPFDGRQATDAEIDEYHELWSAVCRVDYPELPTPTREATAAGLAVSQVQLGEQLVWRARLDGRLAGAARLNLPVDGNDHVAVARIFVHPDLRRQGIATEVLRAVTPTLRERGRTRIEGWDVTDGGTGDCWAKALGFRVVHASLLQILTFADVDPAVWDVPVREGYTLVRWVGHTPEDIIESYVKARNAIGEAPLGESALTDLEWSADRVRRVEADYAEHGIEHRTIVAVDTAGEVAGLTELDARPQAPGRLMQGDTAVLAAHRGHGLGVAMKAEMLRWITADRDGLKQVWTSTGAENTHMAEVNHRLGFETVRRFNAVGRDL